MMEVQPYAIVFNEAPFRQVLDRAKRVIDTRYHEHLCDLRDLGDIYVKVLQYEPPSHSLLEDLICGGSRNGKRNRIGTDSAVILRPQKQRKISPIKRQNTTQQQKQQISQPAQAIHKPQQPTPRNKNRQVSQNVKQQQQSQFKQRRRESILQLLFEETLADLDKDAGNKTPVPSSTPTKHAVPPRSEKAIRKQQLLKGLLESTTPTRNNVPTTPKADKPTPIATPTTTTTPASPSTPAPASPLKPRAPRPRASTPLVGVPSPLRQTGKAADDQSVGRTNGDYLATDTSPPPRMLSPEQKLRIRQAKNLLVNGSQIGDKQWPGLSPHNRTQHNANTPDKKSSAINLDEVRVAKRKETEEEEYLTSTTKSHTKAVEDTSNREELMFTEQGDPVMVQLTHSPTISRRRDVRSPLQRIVDPHQHRSNSPLTSARLSLDSLKKRAAEVVMRNDEEPSTRGYYEIQAVQSLEEEEEELRTYRMSLDTSEGSLVRCSTVSPTQAKMQEGGRCSTNPPLFGERLVNKLDARAKLDVEDIKRTHELARNRVQEEETKERIRQKMRDKISQYIKEQEELYAEDEEANNLIATPTVPMADIRDVMKGFQSKQSQTAPSGASSTSATVSSTIDLSPNAATGSSSSSISRILGPEERRRTLQALGQKANIRLSKDGPSIDLIRQRQPRSSMTSSAAAAPTETSPAIDLSPAPARTSAASARKLKEPASEELQKQQAMRNKLRTKSVKRPLHQQQQQQQQQQPQQQQQKLAGPPPPSLGRSGGITPVRQSLASARGIVSNMRSRYEDITSPANKNTKSSVRNEQPVTVASSREPHHMPTSTTTTRRSLLLSTNNNNQSTNTKDEVKRRDSRVWRGENEEDLRKRQKVEQVIQPLYGLDADLALKAQDKMDVELISQVLHWMCAAIEFSLKQLKQQEASASSMGLKPQGAISTARRRTITNLETIRSKFGNFDSFECLKSGMILCYLLNALRPGCIPKVSHRPIPLMERENIQNYLDGCVRMGLRKSDLFVVSDLYEEKYLAAVLQNVLAVARIAQSIRSYRGPLLALTVTH